MHLPISATVDEHPQDSAVVGQGRLRDVDGADLLLLLHDFPHSGAGLSGHALVLLDGEKFASHGLSCPRSPATKQAAPTVGGAELVTRMEWE